MVDYCNLTDEELCKLYWLSSNPLIAELASRLKSANDDIEVLNQVIDDLGNKIAKLEKETNK